MSAAAAGVVVEGADGDETAKSKAAGGGGARGLTQDEKLFLQAVLSLSGHQARIVVPRDRTENNGQNALKYAHFSPKMKHVSYASLFHTFEPKITVKLR